ncbi:MAG: MFS transporter [Promethearchaeota archaeon]
MLELRKKKKNVKSQSSKEQEPMGINYNLNIWKSYLFHFLVGFQMVSGILIPFYLSWGKISFIEVMFLQSWFTIIIFVFEIPCGAIADYLSRKTSLFLSGIISAIAALIYSSTPNIIIFVIGETLFAMGVALLSGTDEAFIFYTLKKMNREEEISKIMARTRSMFLAGLMISAPLGSILSLFIPLNLIFGLMFFTFIASAFISLTLKEPNHEYKEDRVKYFTIIQSGFNELKSNKILRILARDMIIVDGLTFFLIWTYQLYLETLGVPIVFFGFVGASLTLSQIIFTNLIPKLEKSMNNKKRFLTIYTIIPGIGYLLMACICFAPISIMLIFITIGFGMSRNIMFINGINTQIETENRATVLSTISIFSNLLKAIIYPLVGLLVEFNLNFSFIVLGILIVKIALLSRVKEKYL